MTSSPQPDRDELRAFCAGSLPPERFAVVDLWLASLAESEAERLLHEAGVAQARSPALSDFPLNKAFSPGFVSDLPRGRLRPGLPLGAGGMALVGAAYDRVLDRTVAVKVLRPRRRGELLEQYHLREAAFRREAALTAGLEHPAIPPVYDVGHSDGLPAFAMKRLEGPSFETLVRAGTVPLAERLGILLRVAEAVGYAHSHAVVHRDLTPHNILVAEFGAVYVLDWGLAASSGTQDGICAGTPAWMAPEQVAAAPADPRMDVFALGALAFFAITGRSPRPDGNIPAQLDLAALEHRTVPRGIAALIRRCLALDTAKRYADAGAVADDLRRWFSDGITLAQDATRWELAWLRLHRSPRARTAITVAMAAMLIAGGGWWWTARRSQAEAEARLAQIAATTNLDNSATVAVALDEVRNLALHYPHISAARALEARFQTAHDLAIRNEHDAVVRSRLGELLRRTRTHGPWADQVQAWRAAIRDAGLSMDPARNDDDARLLRRSPLQGAVCEALAFLWRAEKERGADHHAQYTAALLAAAGPSPAWQALGHLLKNSYFAAHDPVFCDCVYASGTLTEAAPTAIALALFAPEPRLTAAARSALIARPGDFWPLIASARASLADGDDRTAEQLAFIASGAEPDSVLPSVLLGYVALHRQDPAALERGITRGLGIDPSNNELRVLHAVALAQTGRKNEAQALVDQLDAGHLQYHLSHAVGHPMERSVQALLAAGLHISDAPAHLGPLSPGNHDGH